jgi:hypothetical protein
MDRDMADLVEHLDELIKENRRTLAGFYIRGDKSSREQARQDGPSQRLEDRTPGNRRVDRRGQCRGNQRLARDHRLTGNGA